MAENVIGRVTATENKPTTCDIVRFWVEDNVVIRPFDVVRIPHLSASETYAIIQELSFITDSPGHLASYVSADFGDVGAEPLNRRLGTTIAEARILCNTKIPPVGYAGPACRQGRSGQGMGGGHRAYPTIATGITKSAALANRTCRQRCR